MRRKHAEIQNRKDKYMSTFVIDSENNITVYGDGDSVPNVPDAERFTTTEEFRQLAEKWPGERLVEVWNGIPGLKPVKKFTDRKTALSRIWKAIQSLVGAVRKETADVATDEVEEGNRARPAKKRVGAKRSHGSGKLAAKPKAAPDLREGTKTAKVLALLRQPKGATLREIMKVTGWQAHSVRGFISGALRRKLGLTVESTKREDGDRLYKVFR
jgi:hypothetical protein